jgi:dTDP-4-dehydrorhamnose 3,5-epimerase
MQSLAQPLPGAHLLQPKIFTDDRGDFVKTYHQSAFADLGFEFHTAEEFFSTSRKGVLRGMHFQLPPHDHAKLVYCIAGRIIDVVVDLRKSSATYGRAASAELSEANRMMFYIPSGFAHGFLSLEERSVTVYKTTAVHSPKHDAGIRWNSFGFDWGMATPIISGRDLLLPEKKDFISPFE